MSNFDATRAEFIEIMARLAPVVSSLPQPLADLAKSYYLTLTCIGLAAMGDAGCARATLNALELVGNLSYHKVYHSSDEVNALEGIANAAPPPPTDPPAPCE